MVWPNERTKKEVKMSKIPQQTFGSTFIPFDTLTLDGEILSRETLETCLKNWVESKKDGSTYKMVHNGAWLNFPITEKMLDGFKVEL